MVALVQVERGARRDVQQLRVFGVALDLVVAPGQRVFEVVRQRLVEVVVLLGRDVLLGTRPQGAGLVDLFPFAGLHHVAGLAFLALFPLFLGHQDGQADVVGILADDALELVAVEVVQLVFAQVQRDAGAAAGFGDGFGAEIAGTAADPAHAFFGLEAGTARFHRDFVCHDEAGVETDAELADQLRIGLLVAGELADEILGAALGDGAQVVDGLLLAHADAVIGNGDGLGGLVDGDAHLEVGLVFVQRGVVERLESQLVAGVGCVADQLAREDVGVGIERMGDQVQQLCDLGLECMGMGTHGGCLGFVLWLGPPDEGEPGRWGRGEVFQAGVNLFRRWGIKPASGYNPLPASRGFRIPCAEGRGCGPGQETCCERMPP